MAAEWREVQLGDVIGLMTGYPFKSQYYTDDVDAPRLIGGDNIAQGNLRWGSVRRWPRNMTNGLDDYWLKPGDVVLAMDRPWIEAGLKHAAVGPQDVPSLLIQRTARLRGTNELDTVFLRYVIGSQAFTEYILSIQTGTAVPHISPTQIRAFRFSLPSFEEQRAIAETLGSLDDRIDNLRQTNATLQVITAALFKSWFVDFDGVPPEDMEESELGLIPKGWRVGSFDEAIEILGGGTPKTSVAEYWGSDIPWFSVVDAPAAGQVFVLDTEKKITAFGLQNCSAKLLPEMTTIISARGTVGKVAMTGVPMAMNQSCYALRPKQQGGEAFVYFSTLRFVEHLQRIAHGAVFDTITRDSFKQVTACLPTDRAIAAFGEVANPLLERIRANGQQAATLAALRDTLLPRLISGRLRLSKAQAMGLESIL